MTPVTKSNDSGQRVDIGIYIDLKEQLKKEGTGYVLTTSKIAGLKKEKGSRQKEDHLTGGSGTIT